MYIQTRLYKPKSAKPKELQISQVSTSDSILLSEILLFNTPLNVTAKPKALFCTPATLNTWQEMDVLQIATRWTSRQCYWENYFIMTHYKSLQLRYREEQTAFFRPYFLRHILCRQSWSVEGKGTALFSAYSFVRSYRKSIISNSCIFPK